MRRNLGIPAGYTSLGQFMDQTSPSTRQLFCGRRTILRRWETFARHGLIWRTSLVGPADQPYMFQPDGLDFPPRARSEEGR